MPDLPSPDSSPPRACPHCGAIMEEGRFWLPANEIFPSPVVVFKSLVTRKKKVVLTIFEQHRRIGWHCPDCDLNMLLSEKASKPPPPPPPPRDKWWEKYH